MSTRSTTHFVGDGRKEPTAIVYRHSDGYPEGAGTDILRFLDRLEQNVPDNRFGDPSYLAAKYVVFLAEIFNQYAGTTWQKTDNGELVRATRQVDPLDFLSVGIVDQDPGDIEYRYTVTCGTGRPEVICVEIGWDRPDKIVPIPPPE
jgi:hypothetical protein